MNLLREYQNSGDIVAMDETRIQVLKEPNKAVTSDKYMWVSLGGPEEQRSVLFHYDSSRSGEVPINLLDGFKGYLQTDGYAGYNAVCEKYGLTHVGCMDHARRKFVEAQKAQPKGKKTKISKADIVLGIINKLYRVERQLNTFKEQQYAMTAEDIVAYRQEHSVPLLNELKAFLENNLSKIPKNSLTHTAIKYTLNQWSRLVVYCGDSKFRISNILAENAIRPFVIGRKAWLFADTPQGANASAPAMAWWKPRNSMVSSHTNTYIPFLLSYHTQKPLSKSRRCYLGTSKTIKSPSLSAHDLLSIELIQKTGDIIPQLHCHFLS